MKRYVYNTKSHTLHIEGFCCHTSPNRVYGADYKLFKKEDEAIAFDGRAVGMCKLCQRRRDKMLKEK